MLNPPIVSTLGEDPPRRVQRINANSFQQNALTTVNGCQYAAFYTPKSPSGNSLYVNLARRFVDGSRPPDWETVVFEDYEQTLDDGHNTISIGVCKGDGTIHVAFDHHCHPLHFRMSKLDHPGNPEKNPWDTSLFTKVDNLLPGLRSAKHFQRVTYPRFINVDDDMLFSFRIGGAGQGDDVLYRYSSQSHTYTYLGTHLTGVANNPYVNGIDYRLGRLHISWTYRASNHRNGFSAPGSNGPALNSGLYYMYSDDCAITWRNTLGNVIATLKADTVLPSTEGITIFPIPLKSGILNQEGQTPDFLGGFHVLNRENTSGEEKWMHYYRNPKGAWRSTAVPAPSAPTDVDARGSLCADRRSNVYFVLPGNKDSSLTILRLSPGDDYGTFETVWAGDDFDGEPLVDVGRLETSDVLSVFTRTDKQVSSKKVVVLDFDLGSV